MNKRQFQNLVTRFSDSFEYVTDSEQFGVTEDWRVPVPDEHGIYRDDCDGYAAWVFQQGKNAGLKMRLVVCEVPTRDGYGGHLVAYCEDHKLFADCQHRHAWTIDRVSRWRWVSMSKVNNPRRWVKARVA